MEQNARSATAKGQAAKERIYDASIRLINERGYDAVTVPAICSKAGISVGAFYHHFNSKNDILLRYIIEESDSLLEYYAGLGSLSRREAMLLSIDYFFGFFAVKGRGFVSAFLAIILSSGAEYYDPSGFSIFSILADALVRGSASGEWLPVGEHELAMARGLILDLMASWCVAAPLIRVATDDGQAAAHVDDVSLAATGRARMAAFLALLAP